jgi:hypothetical protein
MASAGDGMPLPHSSERTLVASVGSPCSPSRSREYRSMLNRKSPLGE